MGPRLDLSRYFLLPDGRLRSGFRFLIFVVVFLALQIPMAWLLHDFAGRTVGPALHPASTVAFAVSIVGATWIATRVLEQKPFESVGLQLSRQSARQLTAGVGLGIGFSGAVALIEWAAGAIMFQQNPEYALPGAGAWLPVTFWILMAAANEEIAFRGYPFQAISEGTNPLAATVIFSLIFGALHAMNPFATGLSIANTMLAGAFLSLAYLSTRALWFPIGWHFAWNWTLAMMGLPVSGLDVIEMRWKAEPALAKTWLCGGDYGPEGGVAATGVLLIGIIWLGTRLFKREPRRYEAESPMV